MKPKTLFLTLTSALAAAAIMITASSCNRAHFILSPQQTYSIVTGTDADSLTLKAASKLKEYFLRITGDPLPETETADPGTRIIFIGKTGLGEGSLKTEISSLSREGFVISSSRDTLVLAGNNGTADLYAVYTMLEEHAGCMKFTETEEFIPDAEKIIIPVRHKVYEPAFSFRVAHFPDRQKPGYTTWHKLSTFSDWGMFVHTFPQLMPPSVYFSEHPEYYSLVNGKRIQDGQLCLSNPDVIRILTENLAARMALAPEKTYWSVSQNDCINYCECPEIRDYRI